MANRQIWVSPNKMWKIVEVKKIPSHQEAYLNYGYIAYATVQKCPGPNYKTLWLNRRGDVIGAQAKYGIPKYVADKAESLMMAKTTVKPNRRVAKYISGTREKYGGRYFTFIDNGREYDMYVIGLDPDLPHAGLRVPYYVPRNRINDKAYRRKQAMNFLADLKKPRVKFNGMVL